MPGERSAKQDDAERSHVRDRMRSGCASLHALRNVVLCAAADCKRSCACNPLCGPTSSGRLIELALALGARLGEEGSGHAFWAPVSTRMRRDGTRAVFPYFVMDRAKPGTVVVDRSGRRFLNESTSYNLFAKAMIAANARTPSVPAFLIADHQALTKYGLGLIRPGGWGLRRAQRDGYVMSAARIEELSEKLAIPADKLGLTIARMNAFAISGTDEDFGRGEGDPGAVPHVTGGSFARGQSRVRSNGAGATLLAWNVRNSSARAFSSELETGSRQESASIQESAVSMPSKRKRL
jgi:hypothetical protein